MDLNAITGEVVEAAMKVHSALGPGLLESAYEKCLLFELHSRGLKVVAQLELPVTYRNVKIDAGYRIDLLVADQVIVEVKAVETILPVHHAQLLSYLKLSNKRVGLLINFHVEHLKDGITRSGQQVLAFLSFLPSISPIPPSSIPLRPSAPSAVDLSVLSPNS